jgi:hypothetical protein
LLATWWKKEGDVPLGRFGAAAQWPPQPRLPPLFLPIKIGEGEEKRTEKRGKRETERPRERYRAEERREKRGEKLKKKEEEKSRKRT